MSVFRVPRVSAEVHMHGDPTVWGNPRCPQCPRKSSEFRECPAGVLRVVKVFGVVLGDTKEE